MKRDILSFIFILLTVSFVNQTASNLAHAGTKVCGKSGTTQQRIQDCSFSVTTSKNVTWNLVSRFSENGHLYEVWSDSKTGLLWGDTIMSRAGGEISFDYNSAAKRKYGEACKNSTLASGVVNCPIEIEKACDSPEGKFANARIEDRVFGLPTADEVATSFNDGLFEVVPRPQVEPRRCWYLTASEILRGTWRTVIFSCAEKWIYWSGPQLVRCVGR